ncbi:MAG: VIT domain-containing protein, partial [Pyrinomonadaceae bacterium]
KTLRPEKVREIYYRLHGKQYNSVPAPRGVKNGEREALADLSDESEAIDNRLNQGLSVSGSQIDASVDGDAALAYLEWTLTFKNEKGWQQEAVSQIQLPPNSVVSRLTLWINGEEREAAFAGRERVAQAYESVVNKRRDPVLLTTAGRDQITVRAFPVPPNGEMKVRIGVTTPLYLEHENSSLLVLPHFNQRNFAVSTEHAVWIESKKPLEIANPAFTSENKENLFAVRGKISNVNLAKTGATVRASKSTEVKTAWAHVRKDSDEIVRQEIVESTDAKPASLVFVIDANAKMKAFQNELAAAIKTLPADAKTALVLTNGNGFNLETAAPNSFAGNPNEIAAKIEAAEFDGGTDSIAALERAWDLTETMPNAAIVWVHTPQPLKLGSADALKQRFMRRPKSSLVYSLQTTNGANTVEKELDGFGKVRTIPRFGKFGDDLKSFFARLGQNQQTFVAVRTTSRQADLPNLANAKETSGHLVRLWANEEVSRLLENNEDKNALDLAVKYQLVTPVSGAVVLETAAQYEQFGLKPVEAGTVPTIPEPEEYLLFAVVIMILVWFGWQYRKKIQTNRIANEYR